MILYTCALSLILYFLMNEWEGKTMSGNIALALLVCHKLCHKLCVGASKRSAFVTGTSALAMGTSALSLMMQDSCSPIHSLPHNFAEIFTTIHSCPHIIAGTFMAIVILNQLRWISVSALASFILNHIRQSAVVLLPKVKWTKPNQWRYDEVLQNYIPRKPPFSYPISIQHLFSNPRFN